LLGDGVKCFTPSVAGGFIGGKASGIVAGIKAAIKTVKTGFQPPV
jgi:hypothetical protein